VVFNKADHTDLQKEAETIVHEMIKLHAPIHGFVVAATDRKLIYAQGRALSLGSRLSFPKPLPFFPAIPTEHR
jgi:hypothetical protein